MKKAVAYSAYPMIQSKALNKNVKERCLMKRIKTIETRNMEKSLQYGGCGECQTSCQSACKTSCGVANQKCENEKNK